MPRGLTRPIWCTTDRSLAILLWLDLAAPLFSNKQGGFLFTPSPAELAAATARRNSAGDSHNLQQEVTAPTTTALKLELIDEAAPSAAVIGPELADDAGTHWHPKTHPIRH